MEDSRLSNLEPSFGNPYIGFLFDKYKNVRYHKIYQYSDISIKKKKEIFMNHVSINFNRFPSDTHNVYPIIYEYNDKPISDYCAYLTINDGKIERCCKPIGNRIKKFNRPFCKEHATLKCYYCNTSSHLRNPFRDNWDFYSNDSIVLLCDECGSWSLHD